MSHFLNLHLRTPIYIERSVGNEIFHATLGKNIRKNRMTKKIYTFGLYNSLKGLLCEPKVLKFWVVFSPWKTHFSRELPSLMCLRIIWTRMVSIWNSCRHDFLSCLVPTFPSAWWRHIEKMTSHPMMSGQDLHPAITLGTLYCLRPLSSSWICGQVLQEDSMLGFLVFAGTRCSSCIFRCRGCCTFHVTPYVPRTQSCEGGAVQQGGFALNAATTQGCWA